MTGPIESLLREAARALGRSGRPFAVIGGIAVSIRAEPRFTRDLDLAVAVPDDKSAESLLRDLQAGGLALVTVIEQDATGRLATVRCQRQNELGTGPLVDLLFASSGIEPEIVAMAEVLEVFPNLRVPVASVPHLIALKVLARDDEKRPQDLVDLRVLLAIASTAELAEVRAALDLITRRGFHRNRPLLDQLEALVESC